MQQVILDIVLDIVLEMVLDMVLDMILDMVILDLVQDMILDGVGTPCRSSTALRRFSTKRISCLPSCSLSTITSLQKIGHHILGSLVWLKHGHTPEYTVNTWKTLVPTIEPITQHSSGPTRSLMKTKPFFTLSP